MAPNGHTFLFSPPSKHISPFTSRRVHLRRLYDVLHLSIQRGDLHRACRAWSILARCKEIDWKTSWMLAIGLLDRTAHKTESNQTKIDYLRTMMLHYPDDREPILCELVHFYVLAGRHGEALDELEFCLPSFPYHDNAVLHIYAGICSILASQPSFTSSEDKPQLIDNEKLDRAQIFFERAKSLDPKNIVVDSFLGMIQNLAQNPDALKQTEASDDEETYPPIATEPVRVKRMRT